MAASDRPTAPVTTDRDRETTGETMDRVSFRVPDRQLEDLDALVDRGRYPNRSEAIRAAVRQLVGESSAAPRGEDRE
ncbi:ribbon-helix-helix domain-containing protein [Halopiger xanaduensis]|uniref:CopG-like domain-containing protein DNA-binding domain n=1 Tax=Halopiger xanaduensis (strain DSM 18323 / JCM 14033 / SH-6) TaxID=797210 RepID=F8DEQ4_HALXS|nr:CopG-like domain-containing protein DNA-binding domain [Halopiger xanaduensis SH-6]